MSAAVTLEPVAIEVIAWQVDTLGRTRCADHADGHTCEDETSDLLRQADTTGCADDYVVQVTRELWTCYTCGRHVTRWPRRKVTVNVAIEHTPCRIF